MRTYQATSSWKQIASNASNMLMTLQGSVRVFTGADTTPSSSSGSLMEGPTALQLWDVAGRGGGIWIKGSGQVRAMADAGANMAASDGDTPPEEDDDDTPPPPPPEDDDDDTPPPPNPGGPPKMIFSTDAAGDVDDLLAMGEVFTAHRKGEIELVALMASASTAHMAPFLRMAADIFGLADVPVGAYKGSGGVPSQDRYTEELAQLFGDGGQTRDDLPSARKIYRQTLSALPKGEKVTIVVVGFSTDMAEFILSKDGDDGVKGSGEALFAERIERIVTQGPTNVKKSELGSNWGKNPRASADVYNRCTRLGVPVIIMPADEAVPVQSGPPAAWKVHNNPLTLGWFQRGTVTRPSYDSMALHYALGTRPQNWRFAYKDIELKVNTSSKTYSIDPKKKGAFSFLETAISDGNFTKQMAQLNAASDVNSDTYPQYHLAKQNSAYSFSVPGTPSVSTKVAKVSGRQSGKFSLSGRTLKLGATGAGLYETELKLTGTNYQAKQFAQVKVMPSISGYDLGDAFGSKSTDYDIWLADDLSKFFTDRSTSPKKPAKVGDRVGSWMGSYRGLVFVATSDSARPILRSNPDVPGTYRLEFSGGQMMECTAMSALDRSTGTRYAGAAYELTSTAPGYVFRDGGSTTDYRNMGCALGVNFLGDARGSIFTIRKLCSALPRPSGPTVTMAGWDSERNRGDIMQNKGGFRTTKIGTSGASGSTRLGGGSNGPRFTGYISGFVACQRPLDDKRAEYLRRKLAAQNGAKI